MTRANWPEYFMNISKEVATRSTCDRKHVGTVIVRDKTILSTGYNGSIRGMPHCDESGHMMENDHCVATIHAEANAMAEEGVEPEADAQEHTPFVRREKKVGRNDPCPCGSGQKYKQCHGKLG